MEPRELNVKFKPARYNEKAEPWQRFGAVWDRFQLRNATETDHGDIKIKRCPEKPPKSHVPLVEHSGKRQIPGYAGYVPRLPIIKDASRIDNPNKIPTTKGTYLFYIKILKKIVLKIHKFFKNILSAVTMVSTPKRDHNNDYVTQ